MIPSTFFFKATLFFYFLGTSLFLIHLWGKERGAASDSTPSPLDWRQRLAIGVTAAGFLCHTAALALRIWTSGDVPFTNLHEAISFTSWATVLVFFWIELKYQIPILGSFILPVAFLSLVSASALPNEVRNLNVTLKSAWLGIHTTLSLLGIVAFSVAFVAGVMYLMQDRLLKSKQFGPLSHKLPALDLLDRWNQASILAGFPLLTLGIISGAMWSQYAVGSFWGPNHPKQMLASGVWLFYLVVLHGRVTIGWRAKLAARMAIVGFAGVILVFVTLMP
jgi:cytochrome c-type biogenesis protein CcsB